MYKEIVIYKSNFARLEDLLLKSRVGHAPIYILIASELLKVYTWDLVTSHLEISFKKININPRFPYPAYLICEDYTVNSNYLPISRSIKDLPKYFAIASKLPTPRENILLQKIGIFKQMLLSNFIDQIFHKIGGVKIKQKQYLHLLRELEFYNRIKDDLKIRD